MNVNEENKSTLPDGWTDDMRPLPENPAVVPTFSADDSSGVVVVEEAEKVDDGAEYWRKKFELAQVENEKTAPYVQIVEHLKTNSDLVDVLEQHIKGEFVEARTGQTIFDSEEEDEYGNPVSTPEPKDNAKGKASAEDPKVIREMARREAHAEMELKQFLSNLISTGVPDHLADKFVHTINNPSGFNIADLYAAFENKESRESSASKDGAEKERKDMPIGIPVSSAGGATDKPTGDRFKETPEAEDQNFVVNPNVL